jgi:hypothetical protein
VSEYRDFHFGYLSYPQKESKNPATLVGRDKLVVLKVPSHGSSSSLSPLNCGNWCSSMLIPPSSSPEPSEAFPQTKEQACSKYTTTAEREQKKYLPRLAVFLPFILS